MGARQVHCPGETLLPLLPLLPEVRDPLEPLLPGERPVEEPEGTRQVHTAEPFDPDGTKPHPLEPLGPLPDGPLNDPLLSEGPTPFDLLNDGPLNEPLLPPEPEGDPFAKIPPLGGAGTKTPGVVAPFHPSAIHPSLRHWGLTFPGFNDPPGVPVDPLLVPLEPVTVDPGEDPFGDVIDPLGLGAGKEFEPFDPGEGEGMTAQGHGTCIIGGTQRSVTGWVVEEPLQFYYRKGSVKHY